MDQPHQDVVSRRISTSQRAPTISAAAVEPSPDHVISRRISSPSVATSRAGAISATPIVEQQGDVVTIRVPSGITPGTGISPPMMESREQNQSLTPGSRRQSSPPLDKKNDEYEISLRIPRRVSFNDDRKTAKEDDPDMRVFRIKVYYSEALIEGDLKTFPQTKVATIVSTLLANRSNFVNNIHKKLIAFGVNPHTRLTLTPVPRVPDDRDYSIAHWLQKYPGAAMVVSPEDEQDSLYRQLVTLKGQPATRNPLYQSEPDNPPIIDPSCPTPSLQYPADTTLGTSAPESNSGVTRTSVAAGTGSSPLVVKLIGRDGISQQPGKGAPTTTSTRDDGSPATQSAATQLCSSPESTQDVAERHRRELAVLEEKLFGATSQLMRFEKEHASKAMTIHQLEEKLEECNNRLDEVEEALKFTTTQSYQARLRQVYRRMFLECVRKRVRAKLRAWFKCPPSPVDYLQVSYDKVLETCEEMEDLEMHVGLKN